MPLTLVAMQRTDIVKPKGDPASPPEFGFELRHLRYFVAVAEHLNFGQAARALHISQPRLARQVRNLERCIGTQLFERLTNGIGLTDAGIAFLVETRRILDDISGSVSTVRRTHNESGQSACAFIRSRQSPGSPVLCKTTSLIPSALPSAM
jgi:DNA-binding transcriptional LysR family regulator